jgi:hypothetical protein
VSVWRVPAAGGQEVKVLDSVHTEGQWTVGQRGIYFFTMPGKQGHSEIRIYEFATSKVRKPAQVDSGRRAKSYAALTA